MLYGFADCKASVNSPRVAQLMAAIAVAVLGVMGHGSRAGSHRARSPRNVFQGFPRALYLVRVTSIRPINTQHSRITTRHCCSPNEVWLPAVGASSASVAGNEIWRHMQFSKRQLAIISRYRR